MKYNIINVNSDKKQTFTNKHDFLTVEEDLINQGYKQLTFLKRKSCINAYYYKENYKEREE